MWDDHPGREGSPYTGHRGRIIGAAYAYPDATRRA